MAINVTIVPFMRHDAYSSGEHASDMGMDFIRHGLECLPEVVAQQVPENPFMFKDCNREQMKRIWGQGWSTYGLLDQPKVFDIEDSDLIIATLHHTACNNQYGFYKMVEELVRLFGRNKVCAFDGSDRTEYSPETASLCPYFKRELIDDFGIAKPVFFAIPEEKFCWDGYPQKNKDFSPMVPANYCWEPCEHLNTYIYKNEEDYCRQYQESFFAYSCKKGGYTTSRQNEIIANRCIPFITDLEQYPYNCLFRYPKELCLEAKRMKGVIPGTITPYQPEVSTYIGDTRNIKPGEERGYIDWSIFDLDEYNKLLEELMKYAWNNLTTKSLARYILEETL
jgi:hypothetical protein